MAPTDRRSDEGRAAAGSGAASVATAANARPLPERQLVDLASRLSSLVARLEDDALRLPQIAPTDLVPLLNSLRNSVMRPLQRLIVQLNPATDLVPAREPVAEQPSTAAGALSPEVIDAAVWELAVQITELAQRDEVPVVIGEAVAALQRLACEGAPSRGGFDPERREALLALQAARGAEIVVMTDGPYVVNNVDLVDWLGTRLDTAPTVALCRCGGSSTKPWCDGSHATNGFSGAKDAKRVPDTLDTYTGQQIVVSDNRGTCAHSGFCTDRASTAFRSRKEPFVAANGARLDELARAVRACPSGALGLRLFGDPSASQSDQEREPVIEISRDGPYRMRGGIPLEDAERQDVLRNAGASREHYSLCRCGHSLNKPFCSGMHWYVDFKDPSMPPDPTIFDWAGGLPALTRLTSLFFEKYVPDDLLLAPLFAEMPADLPARVAAWLAEVFGGPKLYTKQFGDYPHMLSRHAGTGITEEQRARWVATLIRCADESGLPADAEFRSAFTGYLDWGSRTVLATSTEG